MNSLGWEIKRKIGEIAVLGEFGEYLHSPVCTCSTGMMPRLVLAFATSIEGDIRNWDQWIAVGTRVQGQSGRARQGDRGQASRHIRYRSAHDENVQRDLCAPGPRLDAGEMKSFGLVS